MKTQKGFTLIELVMVIVILGILAATAMPKFVNFRDDANRAAADSLAGSLSAASAINAAGCAMTGNVATAGKCTILSTAASAKCAAIGLLMNPSTTITEGAIPDPTVQGALYITAANNSTLTTAGVTCNFTYGNGATTGLPRSFTANATGA